VAHRCVLQTAGHRFAGAPDRGLIVLVRPDAKWIIVMMALALAACSGSVRPNPSYPGFIGTYGPGGFGWLGTNH
jgi:hypothetical protein